MTRSGLSTTCGSARCPIAKLPMRTPATQSAKQLASEYETESAALSCSGALPWRGIPRKMMKRGMGSAVSEAALLLALAIVGGAQAAEPQCTFPNEILDMGHPLHRTSRSISTGGPITIVALGSSSTAGPARASLRRAIRPASASICRRFLGTQSSS
jgi:hypothetical protein